MKWALVLFVVVVVALLPVWPYSHAWGYATSGWFFLMGVILLVLRVLKTI